jgi:urease accessory protein
MGITTPTEAPLAPLRLLQWVSPSLPIGAFTYSQGLEWAVETGWVVDESGLCDWLTEGLAGNLSHVDLPVLARLYRACAAGDLDALARWGGWLIACRETAELRQEERQRGRALATLLVDLGLPRAADWRQLLDTTAVAGFALAAEADGIPLRDAALGYAWAWVEGQVVAGVKLVPLGQTAGQRLLRRLAARVSQAVDVALDLPDDALGASLPALAIASSRHETQYTRLFRS